MLFAVVILRLGAVTISGRRMQWLKHAFAIPSPAAFAATDAERRLVSHVCHEIVRRELTVPALVLLESFRPLGFVASQAVWFSYPWFATLTDAAGLKVLGELLERPGGIDWVIDALQKCDDSKQRPSLVEREGASSVVDGNSVRPAPRG